MGIRSIPGTRIFIYKFYLFIYLFIYLYQNNIKTVGKYKTFNMDGNVKI